jgi:cobalt-zinc-cadmium efflux system outer membrane protein
MYTIRIGSIALLMSLVTGVAVAADRAPLTLITALDRALANHPALLAARLDRDIAANTRDVAALKPITNIGVEVENFAGSGQFNGLDETETTVLVSRLFEGGDKAELRGSAGNQRVELADIALTTTRINVVANGELSFFAALAAQADQQTAQVALDLAHETLALVDRRFQVGRTSGAERNTALIRAERAEIWVMRADQLARAARYKLAYEWGDREPDFDVVAGNLLRTPPVPSLAALERRLLKNPDLVKLATQGRLAAAEQRLAAAQAQTNIKLAAGLRYLAEPGDAAFVMSFSLPIGQKKRAQPLDRSAQAQVAQIPLATEQRQRELSALLMQLHAEMHWRDAALGIIRDAMVPQANESIALYRTGFERGGFTLLELTEAQNRALELQQELIQTASELHGLRIEIDRLTGGALAPGDSS